MLRDSPPDALDPFLAIAWASPDAPLFTLTDINRGLWLKHLDIRNGYLFSYVMNNYWFTNYRAEHSGSSGSCFEDHVPSDRGGYDSKTTCLLKANRGQSQTTGITAVSPQLLLFRHSLCIP